MSTHPAKQISVPTAHQGPSLTASRASARTHSHNSCYRAPHDPYWINAEDLILEDTLHNISINPSTIDGPADGAIFELNHLAEIADI